MADRLKLSSAAKVLSSMILFDGMRGDMMQANFFIGAFIRGKPLLAVIL
jgi:hypothetical protein